MSTQRARHGVAGVLAVVIGTDSTVGGVVGTGIGIVFGVLLSSSPTAIGLEGVPTSDDAVYIVFWSSKKLSMLAFDNTWEETGERGFRINSDSFLCAFELPEECFSAEWPGISEMLLPALKFKASFASN
jgi:hypothetical protein